MALGTSFRRSKLARARDFLRSLQVPQRKQRLPPSFAHPSPKTNWSRLNRHSAARPRAMDNIHVDPHPQFIPLLRPADRAKLAAKPRPVAEQPQPIQPQPIDPAEAERTRLARLAERRRLERLQSRRLLQDRETLRLAIIDEGRPAVQREARECAKWLKATRRPAKTPDEALGAQIDGLWKSTRPSAHRVQAQETALRDLQAFFDATWPGHQLTVCPFGSSVTGIVHDTSDLDVTIIDPSRPLGIATPPDKVLPIGPEPKYINGLPDFYSVRVIAKALRGWQSASGSRPFTKVMEITRARVPIVKLEAAGGIAVDLSVNGRLGPLNSHLIRAYADLRPRLFRPLCFALKKWLKRRGLNDPSGSAGPPSLSSYSIVLLVIQYLQLRGELPNLQDCDLVQHFELQKDMQYWVINAPRRKRGLKPSEAEAAAAAAAMAAKVEACDVTFFDPDARPTWVKQFTQGGRRCWINERIYDVDNLPDFDVWDQVVQDDIDAILGLPESSAVGMHKVDEPNVPAMLGYHFRHFIEWFHALDKPNSIISVKVGLVRQVHTPKQRAAFKRAVEEMQKPPEQRQPDFNFRPLLMFDSTQPAEWESHLLITQDPFITLRNTSANVRTSVAAALNEELHRALKLLQEGRREESNSDNEAEDSASSTTSKTVFADLCQPLAYTTALETPPYIAPAEGLDDNKKLPPRPAQYTRHFRWPVVKVRKAKVTTGGQAIAALLS